MKVRIVLAGCDDSTTLIREVSDSEYRFLCTIAEELNKNSTYGCMPVMRIKDDKEEAK